MLSGKIFVTGGAGYLGRAILRRAERERWPASFTIYSRDEEKHARLSRRYPDVRFTLGDVRDYERLETAMAGHDIVIHAGALKYVPEAELNVHEAVAVNLEGTQNVARAARHVGAVVVVGLSTDKACRPINVYGATKMLMERLFAEASRFGETTFLCCRYGNVVGSTGSVIPLFREQLETRGKVSLTDPNMTRFWLSVDEAIDLIVRATSAGEAMRGSVLIPRCAAMRMGDLATAIAGEAIEVVGPRPGEKQHEELVQFEESGRCRELGDIFELRPVGEPASGERWTYASHSPARWLDVDGMRAMIAAAETP